MKDIAVFKLRKDAFIPKRNKEFDCGLDLFACDDIFIAHGTTVKVSTGIAVNILPGFKGSVENRSSMGVKGLDVGAGVIDPGYNSEISVILHNLTNKEDHDFTGRSGYQIKRGDRVAQLVIYQVALPAPVEVKTLWTGGRGGAGFGSSGR